MIILYIYIYSFVSSCRFCWVFARVIHSRSKFGNHFYTSVCVCVPARGLVPQLLSKLVYQLFFFVSLHWMVCPPSRGLVSLVSQLVLQLVSELVPRLVFLLVSLCWMVCPPSPSLVPLVSPGSFAAKLEKLENNKREMVSGTCCKHFHVSCRCYCMCLTVFPRALLECTHCLVSTAVLFFFRGFWAWEGMFCLKTFSERDHSSKIRKQNSSSLLNLDIWRFARIRLGERGHGNHLPSGIGNHNQIKYQT